MTDPVLLQLVAMLGRIITDVISGTLGKDSALRELEASAEMLRSSLTADGIARGETAFEVAKALKTGGR